MVARYITAITVVVLALLSSSGKAGLTYFVYCGVNSTITSYFSCSTQRNSEF